MLFKIFNEDCSADHVKNPAGMLYFFLHIEETPNRALIHDEAHAVDVVEWRVRVDHPESSNHILAFTEIKSARVFSLELASPISEDNI